MIKQDSFSDANSVAAVALTPHEYHVYGVTLRSDIALALPAHGSGDLARIELKTAPASAFSKAQRELPGTQDPESQDPGSWYRFGRLSDQSTYVRWEGVGEFLVSAGGERITARRFEEASPDSFEVYLLGQALSFALVKGGLEPLHATTVAVNGEAVAFLGGSGAGKSTLAACFLAAGDALLTDDLLILKKGHSGFMAYPGPPRIKLFPELALKFLGEPSNGVPMNSETKKLILPLGAVRAISTAIPLKALYTLAVPRRAARQNAVRITVLPPRESFMALVKNTFNSRIAHPARLERQFQQTAQVVSALPVKKLSYPRSLAELPAVREAILADLEIPSGRQAACAE